MTAMTTTPPAAWAIGTDLELIHKCGFPVAQETAADPHQPYDRSMLTSLMIMLFPQERVRLVRHVDNGKHIIVRHANKTLFITSTHRFKPVIG